MSKMKDSGVQWIGKIPSNWIVNRLRYNCNFKTGGTPPDKFGINDKGDGYPWITAPDMSDRYVLKTYNQYISQDAVRICNYKLFPKHSILLVCIASVGKIGYTLEETYSNQQITALMPNKNCFSKYLLYLMSAYSNELVKDASNSVVPIVNTQYLLNISCCIPKMQEQKLIADFLDEKVDIIDNIICDLNNQIEILNKYKKQLISEIVTIGLNKNVKMIDSEIEWIGRIPEHWNIKLIKNICSLKGRIGWEGLTKDEYISEGPTLITGINFDNGSINWDSCEHVSEWRYNQDKSIQIKNKDLLITKDGTVGKVAIVKDCPEKVTLNSGVLLLRPLNNEYIEKYLYYVLLSNEFWHWFEIENIGNTTIIHLYQNRFAKFKLALPPIDEQKEIANYLDKKCSEIDEILNSKMKQKEQMGQYKKSVIYEYVTGKKRVEGAEELYG